MEPLLRDHALAGPDGERVDVGYAVAGDLAAGREEEPDVGVERSRSSKGAGENRARDEEGA